MANGFGSFYIGTSGLQSAQNAINTTANNLANVDTKGYVRQQVRFADKTYAVLEDPKQRVNMKQSGIGVTIGDVLHARDVFLDKAYRHETGREGFYTTCCEVTSYIEDIMQELSGEEFKNSINDLWKSFQELAKDPANSTNENLVLEKSELLLSRAQALYSDLQSFQQNINVQIKDDIDRVNEIGKRIYQLNLDISKVESNGVEKAMTLRDERDALLDELARYGDIDVSEDPFGFVTVELENTVFIDELRSYPIEISRDPFTGFYTPYWGYLSDDSKGIYTHVFPTDTDIATEYDNDIGSIKAKLYMRGDNYGRYVDMQNTSNYSKVQDHAIMETQAQIDSLIHSLVISINDTFCPNDTAGKLLGTTAATPVYDKNGIALVDASGNPLTINANTLILDEAKCNYGSDKTLPPRELFVRIGCDRYTEIYDASGNKLGYMYNEEDPIHTDKQYALGSLKMNEDLVKQIALMPVYRQDGAVDYEMGDHLTAIWNAATMRINPKDTVPCTYTSYFDKLVDRIGTAGSIYGSSSETMADTVSSIDNHRQQISGVSSDEELTKMIKYQSAYNAASRYITVISQMTELVVGLI